MFPRSHFNRYHMPIMIKGTSTLLTCSCCTNRSFLCNFSNQNTQLIKESKYTYDSCYQCQNCHKDLDHAKGDATQRDDKPKWSKLGKTRPEENILVNHTEDRLEFHFVDTEAISIACMGVLRLQCLLSFGSTTYPQLPYLLEQISNSS